MRTVLALALLSVPVAAGTLSLDLTSCLPPVLCPITHQQGPRSDVNVAVDVPRFDPALGTLSSAELVFGFWEQYFLQVENVSSSYFGPLQTLDGFTSWVTWSPSSRVVPLDPIGNSGARFTRTGGHWIPAFDGALDFGGSSGWTLHTHSLLGAKTQKVRLAPSELAAFVGSGVQRIYLHPVGFDSLARAPGVACPSRIVWRNTTDLAQGATLSMLYRYH